MMVNADLQPKLHVVIPEGVTPGQAAEDIAAILARNGYGIAGMLSWRNGRRTEINMEEVYSELDSGTKLKKVLGEIGISYQTLLRKHKEYQKSLPEGERRAGIVIYKESGRPAVDVPMEWVYDQIDSGYSVKEVAKQLHVGTRTLYSRHTEYQKNLKENMKESADPHYLRKNLARGPACPGSGRRKKELNMEDVYEDLLSGKGICEVAAAYGVTSTTLNNHHAEYQERHKGESGRYIRKTLKDYKNRDKK